MRSPRILSALIALGATALLLGSAAPATAQGQTIKIGTLYDHSGPFSAAGSLNCWRGAKMIIDYVNEKGGVLGKHKICLLYTSPSPRDRQKSRMPSSA